MSTRKKLATDRDSAREGGDGQVAGRRGVWADPDIVPTIREEDLADHLQTRGVQRRLARVSDLFRARRG